IGRALRTVVDMQVLGERQIVIDCDVIQADGGTRTASITGGFVALYQCLAMMAKDRLIPAIPIKDHVAAVSCGIFRGAPVLDLDYDEDSAAETDANFVLTGKGGIIEIQATAEKEPFSDSEFQALLGLARDGIGQLVGMQKRALGLG
ncbi:MAG TPA: ribonuclease PH, partial [Alphaproteobacteria bacterium]|nr:ribonuclease PH [Alphaproteobacteria bacterium]